MKKEFLLMKMENNFSGKAINPCNMKKMALSIGVLLFLCSTALQAQNGLIGWGAYKDLDQNGTTGGSNGPVVRVNSKADLEKYAKALEPYTILVEGSLSGSGMVVVASDKSIIGSGSGATFDGFGVDIRNKKNVILRNLIIKNAKPDAIAMLNTQHAWVDHCDLSRSDDGLLDFTHGSDFLTVSWTIFHDHNKVSIANSGAQDFEDVGKNNVTFHHNWFYNTVQRNPRIGYGLAHVFNNYFANVTSYCIGYHTGANVLVENNFFYRSAIPLKQMYNPVPTAANFANAEETGNIFDSTTGNTKGTGISFNPGFYYDYKFALNSAKEVPALVKKYAGPIPGIEYELLPTPANGSVNIIAAADKLVWSNLENATMWEVCFGMHAASLKKTTTKERSFSPGNLKPDREYFWKVNAIKSDKKVEGSLWKFRTAPAKASMPFPANGELHAKLRQVKTETTCSPLELKWTPGFNAVKYKVYVGTTERLTEADYKGEVTAASFAPGPLKYGVKYYWRVNMVAKDGSVIKGDTWNFMADVVYSKEGVTEVENMVLNGRAFIETQDGAWFMASNKKVVSGEAGPGSMSSIWAGPNAACSVSISYYDENDGKGWYGFFVNENKVDEWFAADNNNAIVEHTINNVQLHTGDELRIAFYTNKGELNRTDVMNIKLFK
jgi:pectate lyase